jgi:hypothetical protein
MKAIKINRLNESHEMDLTKELLNMTVGEMLDSLEKLDTYGDAEYEIVEAALKALNDNISGSGYDSDKSFEYESVETEDKVEDVDFEEDSSMPSYGDIEAANISNQKQEGGSGDFEF